MREPLTKKIKWCYALGQFGWSILSGIVIVWPVFVDMGIRLTGAVAAVLGLGALFVFLKFKEEDEA